MRLVSGIDDTNILAMLGCLDTRIAHYSRGSTIFAAGQVPRRLCLVAHGEVHMRQTDFWGNVSLLSVCGAGDLFGESFVGAAPIPFDVVAQRDSEVLTFDIGKVLTVCSAGCPFHQMVIHNLFLTISVKNRGLVSKLGHITRRTTRDKLISYLSQQAALAGSNHFSISLNRQQLADYLSVDRSALSAELSKMRRDGLLDYRKNDITLFDIQL